MLEESRVVHFITGSLPRDQQMDPHLTDEEVRTREASILHSTGVQGTHHKADTCSVLGYKSKQNMTCVLEGLTTGHWLMVRVQLQGAPNPGL